MKRALISILLTSLIALTVISCEKTEQTNRTNVQIIKLEKNEVFINISWRTNQEFSIIVKDTVSNTIYVRGEWWKGSEIIIK